MTAPSPLPKPGKGWRSTPVGRKVDGVVERQLHVYPVNDAMDHWFPGTACLCAPDADYTTSPPTFIHHSLDGRERKGKSR